MRFCGEFGPFARRLRESSLIASPRMSAAVFGARLLIPLRAVVGVARLVNGAAQRYPVGFLVLELFATWIAWARFKDSCAHPLATWLGEAVKLGDPVPEDCADSSGKHHRFRKFVERDAQRVQRDAAAKVAAGGLEAYPDGMAARLLQPSKSSGGGAGGAAGDGGG